jgi:hypothetical protein
MRATLLLTILCGALMAGHGDLTPPADMDAGVYVANGSDWQEFPVEIVNWKTGGVLKSMVTEGIIKGDLNGRIRGGTSRLNLAGTSDLEIVIRTVDGVDAEEYQLIRLHPHSDGREFRSVTGGVLHLSGGAKRDDVDFSVKKIGQRLWRVVIADLPPGEYGFLPPVSAHSMAASGKIYSFQVGLMHIGKEGANVTQVQNPSAGARVASILNLPAGKKGF